MRRPVQGCAGLGRDRVRPRTASGCSNVWLGISVEDQVRAEERLPYLIATPAAVHFVSAEPLLGHVDLTCVRLADKGLTLNALTGFYDFNQPCGIREVAERLAKVPEPISEYVNWTITGGESGPGARPMRPEWASSLLRQCREAGIPTFMKQVGSRREGWPAGITGKSDDPAQWLDEFRVQQFPEIARD